VGWRKKDDGLHRDRLSQYFQHYHVVQVGRDWDIFLSSGIGNSTGDTRRFWCTENGAWDGEQRAGKYLTRWFRVEVWPTRMLMPVGLIQVLIIVVLRGMKIWWLSLAYGSISLRDRRY